MKFAGDNHWMEMAVSRRIIFVLEVTPGTAATWLLTELQYPLHWQLQRWSQACLRLMLVDPPASFYSLGVNFWVLFLELVSSSKVLALLSNKMPKREVVSVVSFWKKATPTPLVQSVEEETTSYPLLPPLFFSKWQSNVFTKTGNITCKGPDRRPHGIILLLSPVMLERSYKLIVGLLLISAV